MSIKRRCWVFGAVLICLFTTICGVAVPALAAGVLTTVGDTLSNPASGEPSTHTISFTMATLVPRYGNIIINFPAGFNVSAAVVNSSKIFIGSNPVVVNLIVSGQNLLINVRNNSIPADSAISVTLDNITNTALPGTYTITVSTTHPIPIYIIDGPTKSASFIITPSAGPTITWNNPDNITYGTVLSAKQLNAIASVPGSFSYSPAAGTILNAGNAQTLKTTFTPNDTAAYSTVEKSVTINVLKTAQTLNFASPGAKTYGSASFSVSATATSGLAVSFSIVSGPAAISGSTVTINGAGLVTVKASQSGNANYEAAPDVTATFNVNPAALSVKANNLTLTAGSALPALTYTISGYVNGDTAAVVSGTPTLATTATSSSAAGAFPITVAQGTLAAANYTFNLVDGILTVNVLKTAQTLNFASPGAKTYGSASFSVSATATSGLAVSFSIVSGPAAISGSTVTINGAGLVTVKASQSGNANYEAAPDVTATFNVNPAALSVKANNLTLTAGSALPALTYTISGYVNGDTAAVVSGTPTLATTATSSSAAGAFPITVAQGTLAAANYTFDLVDGILTVISGSTGGGGVGGGGFGGGGNNSASATSTITLYLDGLIQAFNLTVNSSGVTQIATQLKSSDQGMLLDIPQGTTLLDANAKVLSKISAAKLPTLPAPLPGRTVILAYDFGPDDAKFNPPLTLTLDYAAAVVHADDVENSLHILFWDGTSWLEIASEIDSAQHTISAQLSHFSQYALVSSAVQPTPTVSSPVTTTVQILTTRSPAESIQEIATTPSPTLIAGLTPEISPSSSVNHLPQPTASENESKSPASKQTLPMAILILIYVGVFLMVVIATVFVILRRIHSLY